MAGIDKKGSPWPGPLLSALVRTLLLLGGTMLIGSCQHLDSQRSVSPCESRPGETPRALRESERPWKGITGKAEVTMSAGNWVYSGRGLFSLELPDRLRWEGLNLLGLADFTVCSDGPTLELCLPSEKKILRGKLDRGFLLNWMGSEAPLSCIVRIVMGYPPLPLDGTSPSKIFRPNGSLLFASGEGDAYALRQSLWLDQKGETWRQGEVLDVRGSWLSFKIEEAQLVDGFSLPRRLQMELPRKGVTLTLVLREIKALLTPDPESFRLPLPVPEGFTVWDLTEGIPGE